MSISAAPGLPHTYPRNQFCLQILLPLTSVQILTFLVQIWYKFLLQMIKKYEWAKLDR